MLYKSEFFLSPWKQDTSIHQISALTRGCCYFCYLWKWWNPMVILFKQNLLSSTVHFFCLMLWNLSRFLSNFSHYIVLGVDGFRKLPGLVVQRPISGNPGLNFSTSFFFIVWSILNFSKWSLLDLLVFSKTLYSGTKILGKRLGNKTVVQMRVEQFQLVFAQAVLNTIK